MIIDSEQKRALASVLSAEVNFAIKTQNEKILQLVTEPVLTVDVLEQIALASIEAKDLASLKVAVLLVYSTFLEQKSELLRTLFPAK
jgi:hypothetical protein